MSLVLLADPAHPLAFLDQLGRKWAGAVVPLYVRAQGGPYDLLGVGSGVLVRRDARMFLVTAHHVAELLRVSARVEAVIGEKLVEITGMRFLVDAGEDVAAAHLLDGDPAQVDRHPRHGVDPLGAVPQALQAADRDPS